MSCADCLSCRMPLHASDGHHECASCLGHGHAEAALTKCGCSFYFRERHRPLRPPFPAPLELRKKRRGQRMPEHLESSEPTPVVSPRASLSPERVSLPVLFTKTDQRPSIEAAGLVSFGGSEEENDDSLSLAASESEEWRGSLTDPIPPNQSDAGSARASADAELLRVLTKAVDDLSLEWSSPEEPTRNRLDKWFLPGCQQAPRQHPAPFFPEVHNELTTPPTQPACPLQPQPRCPPLAALKREGMRSCPL